MQRTPRFNSCINSTLYSEELQAYHSTQGLLLHLAYLSISAAPTWWQVTCLPTLSRVQSVHVAEQPEHNSKKAFSGHSMELVIILGARVASLTPNLEQL